MHLVINNGEDIDGLPGEGVEITCFHLDRAHYMFYTSSDPLLFVAVKDKIGQLQIVDDSRNKITRGPEAHLKTAGRGAQVVRFRRCDPSKLSSSFNSGLRRYVEDGGALRGRGGAPASGG
ncbi:hypothetical protein J5N97_001728 [Dioscorea zingiberensis]|uniref:Uncharacterized protein n=1 Tax=Dioscorea zingiberensis TaxID=325984 RepID=A0A9D5BTQ6_9LILI|nr:hypothetical protein J5N97_001728 [Dioscorea zingiberensis]